jgi:hypothetical protein
MREERPVGGLAKKVFEAFRPSRQELRVRRLLNLLDQCATIGVTLTSGHDGRLLVSPQDLLPEELLEHLYTNAATLARLLTAPSADVLSNEPCNACGSLERWYWLDGRKLCRVCLILDLRPMSLLSGITGGRERCI